MTKGNTSQETLLVIRMVRSVVDGLTQSLHLGLGSCLYRMRGARGNLRNPTTYAIPIWQLSRSPHVHLLENGTTGRQVMI